MPKEEDIFNGYSICDDLSKKQKRKVEAFGSFLTKSLILIPILLLATIILDKIFECGTWTYIPFALYTILYFIVICVAFVYLALWSPACPQCKKRMKRMRIHKGGGNESIYYVCHSCKLYFDSFVQD